MCAALTPLALGGVAELDAVRARVETMVAELTAGGRCWTRQELYLFRDRLWGMTSLIMQLHAAVQPQIIALTREVNHAG